MYDCQRDSCESKLIVFLSTQDSVEFHYRLLSDCLHGNTADTATDANLQLFKLHGDLPQKVIYILYIIYRDGKEPLLFGFSALRVFVEYLNTGFRFGSGSMTTRVRLGSGSRKC